MPDALVAALESRYTEAVRDPLWGNIPLTPELVALTRSRSFQRLRRIQQLGTASAIYPGATHTRAAHSLGVYHLARRLARLLTERGAEAWLTPVGLRSFIAAALCHDLGHFPFAHSLKEFPLEDHESLSGRLILQAGLKELVADTGADPYMTAAIVDKSLPSNECGELAFYRRLLSGVLDPDKLDYLNRDARYCGVPYGAQDVDFIFSRLEAHPERGVDIDSKGLQGVEAILFAKYLMYRSVYWHRDVRAATAMIKKGLLEPIQSRKLPGEQLYDLDDAGLFTLLAGLGTEPARLSRAVQDGAFYAMAYELPFDPAFALAPRLEDLRERSLLEAELSRLLRDRASARLGKMDLIIDLPEPISFESDLFVRDEGVPFSASSTVFNPQTVSGFVRSLRTLRVFVRPELSGQLIGHRDVLDAFFRA